MSEKVRELLTSATSPTAENIAACYRKPAASEIGSYAIVLRATAGSKALVYVGSAVGTGRGKVGFRGRFYQHESQMRGGKGPRLSLWSWTATDGLGKTRSCTKPPAPTVKETQCLCPSSVNVEQAKSRHLDGAKVLAVIAEGILAECLQTFARQDNNTCERVSTWHGQSKDYVGANDRNPWADAPPTGEASAPTAGLWVYTYSCSRE